jgi:hypothetical protein
MNFNNPEHRKEMLRRIRERCVEMPPPPESNLPDQCWIARSKIDDLVPVNEYVRGKLLGRPLGQHEITQMLASGILRSASDDGLEVLHRCNRKACCNPTHLELGTRKQNNDAAIADKLFDPKCQTGIPKPSIQGEGNARAKASNLQAAEAKYLFSHPEEWYVREISAHHSVCEAIAIHLNLSEPSLKRIEHRENWRHVQPVRPEMLPSIKTVPANAKPPRPKMGGPIGPENAALILRGYWPAEDKPGYITMWKEKLGVSRISVQKVLTGATWADVERDIQREKNFDSHRQRTLSDRSVQAIRATYAAYKEHPRIKSALAERFHCKVGYVTAIVEGVVRMNVAPDPNAALPLDALDLKPKAQHGHLHKLAELEPEQVWAILLRLARKDKVLDRVITLCQEFKVSQPVIYGIRSGERYKEICKRFDEEQRRKREQDEKGGGK